MAIDEDHLPELREGPVEQDIEGAVVGPVERLDAAEVLGEARQVRVAATLYKRV